MVESKKVMGNAELEALRAEVSALRARLEQRHTVTMKVSKEKRVLSLYGINTRNPVNLYAAQWQRVLAMKEQILAFIEEHKQELAWKASE